MKKLLGIDFGLKKIGLAYTQAGWVQPLAVIKNDNQALSRMKKICREYGLTKIVLGLPEGDLRTQVKLFGQKLHQQLGWPVVFQDETLTTQEAIAKMIVAGKKKQARREKEDAFAAALILESFLQVNPNV